MKSILVTGGAGFIGSCFVRKVIRDSDSRVLVLDKLTYAACMDALASVIGNNRFELVEGAIEDRPLVGKLLEQFQPDAIVNFAAESHVDRSIARPSDFVTTNVVGTFQLLDAAREFWNARIETERAKFRFVQISTDEVYGSLEAEGLFREDSKYQPNSPYSASKAAADHFVRAYYQTYGLPVLTTNSANNYGPFQHREKLIPLVIQNAIEGKELPIYGDGQQIRDWLFVEDHCDGIWQVLNSGRPGEVYHIGARCERTNLELVEQLCGIVDELLPERTGGRAAELIRLVDDRPGHDRRYALDCTKIANELGWSPKFNFDSAIRETTEWYVNRWKATPK